MAKKTLKLRAWTKEDIRMLKSLVRESLRRAFSPTFRAVRNTPIATAPGMGRPARVGVPLG